MQQKRAKTPSCCINKTLITPQIICLLALYRQVYLVIIVIHFRTSRPFIIPPVSNHFADPLPTSGPYIFPAFQNQLWLPQARLWQLDSQAKSQMSPYQSASASGVSEGPRVENSSKDASTKGHSPNWLDTEIRFLFATWKDHHPISKRQNSAVWESIARELNSILSEQGLTSIHMAAQRVAHYHFDLFAAVIDLLPGLLAIKKLLRKRH